MNFQEEYEKACVLLGKNKDSRNFDLVKELNKMIQNRDFWKNNWANQHEATGRAYWWGYKTGYDHKEEGRSKILNSGLRS